MKTRFVVLLRLVVLAVCGAAWALAGAQVPVPKTAVTTDVSDVWWNPSESGWGMQLVQEDDFVFATLFIYGADGRPTWITAQLTYKGGGVFSGTVYATTGSYYGGTYNGANGSIRPAGTMTFTLQSVQTAQLQYSVDGVTVNKSIQRQTLTNDNFNGIYVVTANLTQSGCTNPANNGSGTGALAISVTQAATAMSMIWQFTNTSSCTYNGTYTQSGKMGRFSGPYSCTTGETGTMSFIEMTNRIGMLSGRIQGTSTTLGCAYSGRFTGLDPSVP
jgi:hypothetical protein